MAVGQAGYFNFGSQLEISQAHPVDIIAQDSPVGQAFVAAFSENAVF